MVNPKFRARWVLYLAGLTVPQIIQRERSIKKHREAQILKDWSKELSAADAAFINLSIRRGQLA